MKPLLSWLMAPEFVIMKAYGTLSDDKLAAMTTLRF